MTVEFSATNNIKSGDWKLFCNFETPVSWYTERLLLIDWQQSIVDKSSLSSLAAIVVIVTGIFGMFCSLSTTGKQQITLLNERVLQNKTGHFQFICQSLVFWDVGKSLKTFNSLLVISDIIWSVTERLCKKYSNFLMERGFPSCQPFHLDMCVCQSPVFSDNVPSADRKNTYFQYIIIIKPLTTKLATSHQLIMKNCPVYHGWLFIFQNLWRGRLCETQAIVLKNY